jgi:hypothetical protein
VLSRERERVKQVGVSVRTQIERTYRNVLGRHFAADDPATAIAAPISGPTELLKYGRS